MNRTLTDPLRRREAGLLLRRAHRYRFYLQTHRTFAAFCRDAWDISPRTAYRLLREAESILTRVV